MITTSYRHDAIRILLLIVYVKKGLAMNICIFPQSVGLEVAELLLLAVLST